MPSGFSASSSDSSSDSSVGVSSVGVSSVASAGIEGNRLVNALSVGLILVLLPLLPPERGLYLPLSLAAFGVLAVANHLFPVELARLTHGVKAAYTHLLFALLGVTVASPWFIAAWVVTALDLTPLVARGGLARGAEAAGATVRAGAIVMAFYELGFPAWLLTVFGAGSVIYFLERRARMSAGRRWDYGILHCVEHLVLLALVLALLTPPLELVAFVIGVAAVIATIAVVTIALGVRSNRRALETLEDSLPHWFDRSLGEALIEKARANAGSRRLQHYVVKPFTPKISNRRVRWSDVEAMFAAIELPRNFDVCVGVLSGGAFIARCLTAQRGFPEPCYVRSRLWSQLPLHRNAVTSSRYYLGRELDSRPSFVGEAPALMGKKVLVIDDSTCTGATLASTKRLCLELGAAEVETLSLFCHPAHPADHYFEIAPTPLVWPWGWEAD